MRQRQRPGVDPITLEVLRHRLWMINDEQGKVATQISGSPVVYEAYDFNSSLLTPQGDSLFVGVYTTRLSLCLHLAAKHIIAHLQDDPGFEDGDAFITNDPWAGASHMNDFLMLAPIFWEGEIVCWSGIAMHEMDVGGPNPGSFTVGAKEVYGEGPIIAPVKIVERGKIRKDIENLVTRNSRTPELNALDIRARVAAINRTRKRIHEVIEEYGKETFLEVQRQIMELVRRAFTRRLSRLPDGTWREEGFIDHDGNRNQLYPLKLAMTKRGGKLIFDFRGTSPQAPGMINCTRTGLEGGVMSAVLPMICYDMPWSPGALQDVVEIVSEEGTLNNATHPAAVSMATVAAAFATGILACSTIAKMYAASEQEREEAQATWSPGWQGTIVAGFHEDGRGFTGTLLDQAGASGARPYKDGMDTGGLPGSPCQAIANVETYERLYPLLYVYRKQAQDTGGPGKYRGGVGTELMMVPHRSAGPIDVTLLSQGASQPEAKGIYGGYPSSVQVRLMLRHTNLRDLFRSSFIPTRVEEVSCREVEPLEAKDRVLMAPGDALVAVCAGGGGYGDPLERDPHRVHQDVLRGRCSFQVAEDIYGVKIDRQSMELRLGETEERRRSLRRRRLEEGTWVTSRPRRARFAAEVNGTRVLAIGDALEVVRAKRRYLYACRRCGYLYGTTAQDPKAYALSREVPITRLSPWNRYGLVAEIVAREFYCPHCALMIGVEVRKKGDPPIWDTHLELRRREPREARHNPRGLSGELASETP